ncbi:hypothetical protein [Actinomyces lilanjuaniae]|uniref:hypothetical protein n=1 Tax=Actinomyces lilanjuaniae TaxID=2321394 RepID=UPI0013C3FE0D|nr:hypothetical protein [Actinomyces lilanjuaniae]
MRHRPGQPGPRPAQAQDHVLGPDFSAAAAQVAASIAASGPGTGGSDGTGGGPGGDGGPDEPGWGRDAGAVALVAQVRVAWGCPCLGCLGWVLCLGVVVVVWWGLRSGHADEQG